jgi:hypothetical protein
MVYSLHTLKVWNPRRRRRRRPIIEQLFQSLQQGIPKLYYLKNQV